MVFASCTFKIDGKVFIISLSVSYSMCQQALRCSSGFATLEFIFLAFIEMPGILMRHESEKWDAASNE